MCNQTESNQITLKSKPMALSPCRDATQPSQPSQPRPPTHTHALHPVPPATEGGELFSSTQWPNFTHFGAGVKKQLVFGQEGVSPFPEACVVWVSDCCDPAFYPGQSTLVHILPKVSLKEGTRMTRRQFPLVAGSALTTGLTIHEGVVICLVESKRFRPASKHGLPFVTWTRSESFVMTAFKKPPAMV